MTFQLNFTTYFNSDFIEIGITAIERFLRFNPNSRGTIFCFEHHSKEILEDRFAEYPVEFVLISDHANLKTYMDQLLSDRSPLEVLISLKPKLIFQCLEKLENDSVLVYFDPDIMFFGQLFLDQVEHKSFFVTKQLGVDSASASKYGAYNAGLIIVRNCLEAKLIVQKWWEYCKDWCKLTPQSGRYADQKYLDCFESFPGFGFDLSVTRNLTARAFVKTSNLNIELRRVRQLVLVNSEPLESFHFHGLRVLSNQVLTGINRFGKPHPKVRLFRLVYLPIVLALIRESYYVQARHFQSLDSMKKYDKTITSATFTTKGIILYIRWLFQIFNLTRVPLIRLGVFTKEIRK